jgi:hypothetical protein
MIQITLTDEQAKLLAHDCEVYARVAMGQFTEISYDLLSLDIDSDDYCARRDKADELLLEARKYIYPELHGRGHSYGIGKFESADKVWDVYQAIRVVFGDKRASFSYYKLPEVIHFDRDDEQDIDNFKS